MVYLESFYEQFKDKRISYMNISRKKNLCRNVNRLSFFNREESPSFSVLLYNEETTSEKFLFFFYLSLCFPCH